MLIGVITARALSVGDLGIYVSAVVVTQSVGSVAASFASASGYFVSKQHRPAAEVAANGALLSAVAGLGLLAVALLAWTVYGEGAARWLPFIGVALFPIIARNALGGVFLGTNSLWRYNFSLHGPAYAAVALLLVWVVALDHRTTESALGAWIAAQYVSLVILAILDRSWWGWLVRHRPDWRLIWHIVTFGALIGLAGFISFFNYRVDQLLVAGLDGRVGAGIYSRAVSVAEALWLFSTSIAVASYASVGSLDRHEAAALTTRAVRHTLVAVTCGAIAVFVLAPLMLEILFGARYSGATTSLRILCVGTALFAPQSLLANYFTIQMGRPWISLLIALSSCLINIAVCLVLIPQVGYAGGAWATTISYAAVAVPSIVVFLRLSDARLSDLFRIRRDDIDTYTRLWRRVWSGEFFGRARSVPDSHP